MRLECGDRQCLVGPSFGAFVGLVNEKEALSALSVVMIPAAKAAVAAEQG